MYCLKCYNEFVVSNCSTETLFQDLFQVEDQVEEEERNQQRVGQTHRKSAKNVCRQLPDVKGIQDDI